MFKYLPIMFVALSALFCAPVFAGDPDDYKAEVKAVKTYLNQLGTAKARFVQTSPNGMQLVGSFFLNRPGKLRFEYDDPVEDFVVADGSFIYFFDAELDEQMNMPIGQSLADFVLRKDIDFSKDVIVSDVRRGQDLLQVKLVQKSDPDAGSISFAFSEEPLVLRKWRVTDAQNLVTEVELFYLEQDIELDDSLFVYLHPKFGQEPRYND